VIVNCDLESTVGSKVVVVLSLFYFPDGFEVTGECCQDWQSRYADCHSTRIVFHNNDGTAVHFLFRRCGLVPKRTFTNIYGNRRFVRPTVFTEHVQNQFVLVHVFRPVSLRCVFILRAIETWH
jgi:hypothetical protein